MINPKDKRWYCDICKKNEAAHGQVSGGDRDMCYDCYEVKGYKDLGRVEIELLIKQKATQV